MGTEKCPFIGIDCEYIPLARKFDAQAKEIERLREALTLVVTYQEGFTLTIEEVVAAAREALKEKE